MKYKLILASESPRRSELLTKAGFQFTIHPSKISETLEENLNVDEQILALAKAKAHASFDILPPTMVQPYVILAADTMVVVDDKPLGKPTSVQDAIETLRLLSNRSHLVKTAICLIGTKALAGGKREIARELSHIETTEVSFRNLSDQEILEYVKSGEPMDKAGSYGIQGKASVFVQNIRGSFSNVVGLPFESLERILRDEFQVLPSADA